MRLLKIVNMFTKHLLNLGRNALAQTISRASARCTTSQPMWSVFAIKTGLWIIVRQRQSSSCGRICLTMIEDPRPLQHDSVPLPHGDNSKQQSPVLLLTSRPLAGKSRSIYHSSCISSSIVSLVHCVLSVTVASLVKMPTVRNYLTQIATWRPLFQSSATSTRQS